MSKSTYFIDSYGKVPAAESPSKLSKYNQSDDRKDKKYVMSKGMNYQTFNQHHEVIVTVPVPRPGYRKRPETIPESSPVRFVPANEIIELHKVNAHTSVGPWAVSWKAASSPEQRILRKSLQKEQASSESQKPVVRAMAGPWAGCWQEKKTRSFKPRRIDTKTGKQAFVSSGLAVSWKFR